MRGALLAAVTLLATAVVLLVVGHRGKAAPAPPTGVGQWSKALAAPYSRPRGALRGACGVVVGPRTMGIAHPVLPCGVKLFVEYKGKTVLTQVIDRGPSVAGRRFDLTKALAGVLGVHGTRLVRWRFAR
jgi:rare lipoprotein A (peptidoglycan hydrolase)